MSKLTINPHIARLSCSMTGDEVDHRNWSSPIGLSPAGFPVTIEYDLDAIAQLKPGPRKGLWRHRNLLPVWGVPDDYAVDVGDTPTFRSEQLSARYNMDVWVKNEGTNPTWSFKDRGLAVAVALGAALGAESFFLPTQGNAGVAATLFSTRLGVPPCEVTMPDGYQGGMYHQAVRHFGGRVSFHGANIAAAGKHARKKAAPQVKAGKKVDLSTFFEPGRLEGKKTMGLEIAEQFGNHLPDWIIYPTGGGTGLVGIWKALLELGHLGELRDGQELPRMVAVQSRQCAPVVRSFEKGHDVVTPVTSNGTIADGLDVPGAIMGHAILQVLRDSEGTAVAVADKAIKRSFKEFALAGVPAGYEGAATLAALNQLKEAGTISKGQRVLLLNTGGPAVALSKEATP